MSGRESLPAGQREYEVELTIREHFTVFVTAANPVEAREKALLREWSEDQAVMHGDREITAARARRAE